LPTIIVRKRSDGFEASLEGEPDFWGSGPTTDAAVGDLVRLHTEKFGIVIRSNGDARTARHVPKLTPTK